MFMSARNDSGEPPSGNPGWILISLGAILGVITSLILVQLNWMKRVSRHQKKRFEDEQDTGLDDSEISSMPGQDGLSRGNTSSISQVGSAGSEIEIQHSEKTARELPAGAPAPTVEAVSKGPAKTGKPIPLTASPDQSHPGNRWSTPTRYIMGVFLFLAALVVLFIGRLAIPLVLAAALLALFVDPVIKFFVRRLRMKHGLAVGITYFFVIVVLLLIPLLAIPAILDAGDFITNFDLRMTVEKLSEVIQSTSASLQAYPGLSTILAPVLGSIDVILQNLLSTTGPGAPAVNLTMDELTSGFGQALGFLASFLGPTFSVLASIFFTFLLSMQITLTADEVKNWYSDLIPPSIGPEFAQLIQQVRRTWTGFLRGQMLLMLVVGVITWLGGVILGLPQPLLLGVLAGLMELIPNIGPILAAIPAVLLALIFGSTHFALNNILFALLVVGFYVLVQLMENQLLVPRIMGDAVDLPTLVVLIGTIAGAGAFGILGALLATPVIATGNLVFRYIYRKILENPPVEEPPEEKPGLLESVRGFLSRLRRPASPSKVDLTEKPKKA
jgi:predicted PurR-regulated permease PerM